MLIFKSLDTENQHKQWDLNSQFNHTNSIKKSENRETCILFKDMLDREVEMIKKILKTMNLQINCFGNRTISNIEI